MVSIDKGVPVPPSNRNRWGAGGGRHAEVYNRMEEGDSVFFEVYKEARLFRIALKQATDGTPFKAVSSPVEGGYRVWKVRR